MTLGKSQNILGLTFHVYEVGWPPRGGRGKNDRKVASRTANTRSMCAVFTLQCCVTNCPKCRPLKTTRIYCLTVSTGQESAWPSWPFASWSLIGHNQAGARACSHLSSTSNGSPPKLTHVLVGRIWCLLGCWTADPASSLILPASRAAGQRPHSGPCCMGLSPRQLTTWQLASFKESKRVP